MTRWQASRRNSPNTAADRQHLQIVRCSPHLPHERSKALDHKREFPGRHSYLLHQLLSAVLPISRNQIQINFLETMLLGELIDDSNKKWK